MASVTGPSGSGPDLEALKAEALEAVGAAGDEAALEQARVAYLGRKAPLKELLSSLGAMAPEARREIGQRANAVAREIEEALRARAATLREQASGALAVTEAIDLTFPGIRPSVGHLHLVTLVAREIEEIFRGLGYDVARGPEVETDYYNFEALNIPKGHPARDGQDTFFIAGQEDVVLRTQTSPMQIHYMEANPPPLRVIIPGKVYRRDNDATHVPMFHQVEGLLVDEDVTVADLKGTLEYFAREMFGPERRIRLRPDYFPFTEPSLEVHVSCFICDGRGCRLCGMSGWIEILGSGMVHPNVLRAGGVDPERYTGFAFGLGIDRVAMLKYGVDDLRLFFENDLRMTRQF